MICYSLQCSAQHAFEGWFRDSAGYDEQRAEGEVICPHCGDTEIVKAPMAPSVPKKDSQKPDPVAARAAELTREVEAKVEQLRQHVEENCENVGDQFPEEARKIHYGETEERGIYGEASVDEAKELIDEGIEVYNLPKVKRRKKN